MKLRPFAATALFACVCSLWAQQNTAAPNQPKAKSQAEVEALQKVQSAPDPDARMQAIDGVLEKFADTEYKPILLQMAMQSAEQKGDYEKTTVYAERVLQSDPNNFFAQLTLASEIARHTREFDLDKDQKLAKVDQYANGALSSLKTAQKPNPQLSDPEWENAKKDYSAQAHDALGLANLLRKKNDAAVTEFKTAVDSASKPDPASMIHLAQAYVGAKQYDDAIAQCDKAAASADASPQVKQVAAQLKQQATKMKGGGGSAGAANTAPPPSAQGSGSQATPPAPK